MSEIIDRDEILSALIGESAISEMADKVLKVLKDLVSSSQRIAGALIATPEGFPVASYPPEFFREEAKIAAAIAAIFATSERNALDMAGEHVDYVAIKTVNKYILLRLIGEDHILAVITNEGAKLGILMRDLNRAIEKLKSILSRRPPS
ncbi:MAG: roadblock/LC7 domain-containing protein [Candidatus Njordarchaeales archaeon]